MNSATQSSRRQVIVWVVWFLVFLAALLGGYKLNEPVSSSAPLLGVVTHDERRGNLFPWQVRYRRWKKHALRRYRAWQQRYRQAKRTARLACLVMVGAVPLARLVEWLTATLGVPAEKFNDDRFRTHVGCALPPSGVHLGRNRQRGVAQG